MIIRLIINRAANNDVDNYGYDQYTKEKIINIKMKYSYIEIIIE